jgi:hypothetical protein
MSAKYLMKLVGSTVLLGPMTLPADMSIYEELLAHTTSLKESGTLGKVLPAPVGLPAMLELSLPETLLKGVSMSTGDDKTAPNT